VDIGAIEFIHRRLVALRDAGVAILLISVELEEILGLSDRILVMAGGMISGEMDRSEATEERLGLLMAGIGREESKPGKPGAGLPGGAIPTGKGPAG
jgi:simple sugar transport system ATP-binding protein